MPDQESSSTVGTGVSFGGATPILRVADLDASVEYYQRTLGFGMDWRVKGFAQISRGNARLMLCEREQGHAGTWVWIGVSDADALHEEAKARGARIRHEPTNYPWGSRELHVWDLDGHVLRLGSELKPDEQAGEWLDSDGVRWLPEPDGSWRRVE